MNSIPMLHEQEDEIRESLSLEEIRIALNFLKKRFRDYTIKEIVQALSEYLLEKESAVQSIPIGRPQGLSFPRVPQAPFMHHRHYPINPEERSTKSEELRLIAKLYCESGIKYSLAQYFFPDMTQKNYKLNLEIITAQTVNNIDKFLRYECNVQIQQLSRQEKRSIREKMVNVRDWLGKTNPEQIQTYFLFIERHYLNENVEIEYKQAIELYKLILQSVKGPDASVRETENHTNRGLRQQFRLDEESKKTITKEEENALILLFKQFNSVEKVADAMCQKYGYDIKWSIHSVRGILKRIYKSSLKKLVDSAQKILNRKKDLWFGYGDQDVNTLMEYENSLPVKLLLLDFYMVTTINELKLREFIKKINEFYIKQYRQQSQGFQIIPEEEIQVPTLIIDDKQPQAIVIKDDGTQIIPKKESIREQNRRRIHKANKNKKIFFKEFVEVDMTSDEQEINIRANYKKIDLQNEQTDVQDSAPFRKGQKQIFKPKQAMREQKMEEKKKLKDLKQLKPINVIRIIPEEKPPQNESQEKQAKIQPEEPTTSKKQSVIQILKKPQIPNINYSVDSIESEPVRLSFYKKSKSSKERNFGGENTSHRFKRKIQKSGHNGIDLEKN